MKVVVIGGTGLIGSKVVAKRTEHGHEAIAASPETGVVLDARTLVPATTATVLPTRFEDWLIDNALAPVR
jgi:uncharacterized protein YbjT (DUF2867 family)